jgi:hypothetical protein
MFLSGYKGIHLTLELKSFIISLSLRRIPVQGLAIGSLDLPLVATIDIAGKITKQSLSDYALQDWPNKFSKWSTPDMQKP